MARTKIGRIFLIGGRVVDGDREPSDFRPNGRQSARKIVFLRQKKSMRKLFTLLLLPLLTACPRPAPPGPVAPEEEIPSEVRDTAPFDGALVKRYRADLGLKATDRLESVGGAFQEFKNTFSASSPKTGDAGFAAFLEYMQNNIRQADARKGTTYDHLLGAARQGRPLDLERDAATRLFVQQSLRPAAYGRFEFLDPARLGGFGVEGGTDRFRHGALRAGATATGERRPGKAVPGRCGGTCAVGVRRPFRFLDRYLVRCVAGIPPQGAGAGAVSALARQVAPHLCFGKQCFGLPRGVGANRGILGRYPGGRRFRFPCRGGRHGRRDLERGPERRSKGPFERTEKPMTGKRLFREPSATSGV